MVLVPAIDHPTPGYGVTLEAPAAAAALRLTVSGIVQGVGFRPFVHRLAHRHHLTGWVRNTSGNVEIVVEGDVRSLEAFRVDLPQQAPPLSRIESISAETATPGGRSGFTIIISEPRPDERQPVSPDISLCTRCLAELSDPADRRYRYPFTTCTDCGPRITIIEDIPYDRARTTMRAFHQCPECLAEYQDPGSRRFHSQTNSCPACGPTLAWLTTEETNRLEGSAALVAAAGALERGGITAVRGLGGFHLAVDATNSRAVQRLRQRKGRAAKPLAVMVRTVAEACTVGAPTDAELELLARPERPIVLVALLPNGPLAPEISPGLGTVGLMLPYTPLHHLLLELVGRPLVMTSGNISEEPIAADPDEAVRRLGHIADGFLTHDREIVNRYDDSVMRVASDGVPIVLRRARGYAPRPLRLPLSSPVALVATGPQLKNTFTLAEGRRAFVSQHLGDLENLATVQHFRDTLERYQRLFRIRPTVAVHDLHPGYLSTTIARDLGLDEEIAVQHHHAHVAAVMGEHGISGPVIGVAYDGTGYGDDGTVWGAEILVADLAGYRRAAHLWPAPLPGGDAGARAPWRAALGYRHLARDAGDDAFANPLAVASEVERGVVERQLARGINAPLASSMGRLFDAAASILGLRHHNRYEGQAAMELESLAGNHTATPLPYTVAERDGRWVFDPLPTLIALGRGSMRGENRPRLAAAFHETVVEATAVMIDRVREETGIDVVVLSGGSLQNARLHRELRQRLEDRGLSVLVPVELSPNDGAVSYGQAVVAAALLRCGSGAPTPGSD